MNTIVYQNKDLEYHFIQLGNYPTPNFFEKCERYGLKVFVLLKAALLKKNAWIFRIINT
jgi:hypothetical protein